MQTFTLTATGYLVHLNGELQVICAFDPEQPGETPFASDEAKRTHAQANYPDATEL